MGIAVPATGRSGRRLVTALNATVAVAVIGLVAAVALVIRPPAPPGIAEFAPQASKPITKAPPGLSSKFGNGTGPCAAGRGCVGKNRQSHAAALAPAGAVGNAPSALQCFTWPSGAVTQTFDPQSPPCIASWPGHAHGNGGATWRGVSATTIRVATPNPGAASETEADQAIVTFINTHFELYDRRIQLQFFNSAQGSQAAAPDPSKQVADARTVASALGSFAAVSYGDTTWTSGITFADALARKHVITVNADTIGQTSTELSSHAPYEWNFRATLDQVQTDLGAVYCRQLTGHAARFGGADVASSTRKLGVLLPAFANGEPTPSAGPLASALSRCGVKAQVATFPASGSFQPGGNPSTEETLLSYRKNGVTTIIPFAPDQADIVDLMIEAQKVAFTPEWLLPGLQNDANGGGYTAAPGTQIAHAFGLAPPNKPVPLPDEPYYESATAADPAVANLGLANAYEDGGAVVQPFYESMLLLASGIQEAGPKLTPATFQQALHATSFPDPGAGQSPLWQAGEGTSGSGHTLLTDFALKWWSANAPDYWDSNQPPGGWCYLGNGTRYTQATLPASDSGYFDSRAPCS